MIETLAFLAEDFRLNWSDALAAAGPDPGQQLIALIEADFHPVICAPARLAAWCAFWGQAQSRPLHQQHCGAKDDEYSRVLEGIRARLAEIGSHDLDPVHIARIIRVTIEGIWLDMMTIAGPYPRSEASQTVRICTSLCFPDHFDRSGPRLPEPPR